MLTDNRPDKATAVYVECTTNAAIAPLSTIRVSLDSAFTLPATLSADRVRFTLNGVTESLSATATASKHGVARSGDELVLTISSGTTIGAGATIALLFGTAGDFTTPQVQGSYTVTTSVKTADNVELVFRQGQIVIVSGVTVGADTKSAASLSTQPAQASSGSSRSSDDSGEEGSEEGAESSEESSKESTEDAAEDAGATDTEVETDAAKEEANEEAKETTAVVPSSDITQDAAVDLRDADALSLVWDSPAATSFDLSQDGVVNVRDLGMLISSWTGSVPERSERFPVGPPRSVDAVVLGMQSVSNFSLQALHTEDDEATEDVAVIGEVGETITILLTMSTGPTPVNAVDIRFAFSSDTLRLVDVSTTDSAISVWVRTPSERESGILSFAGGIPGGLSGSNIPLVLATFTVLSDEDIVMAYDTTECAVVFADEAATYAPLVATTAAVEVDERTIPVVSVPVAVVSGTAPVASDDGTIVLWSSTHGSQQEWYSSNDVEFFWSTPESDGFSYTLGAPLHDVPDTIAELTETSLALANIEDGIWVFALRRLCATCTEEDVARYTVRIDTQAPEPFTLSLGETTIVSDHYAFVSFAADDTLSGVSHYETVFHDMRTVLVQGPLVLPETEEGRYELSVTAYDRAGNRRTETARVTIGTDARLRPLAITGLVVLLALVVFFFLRERRRHRS